MSKEESFHIPVDEDEIVEFGFSPLDMLVEQPRLKEFTTLETEDHVRRKVGRKEKLRLPIPKKLRIELVKERGGICQKCSDELYQQIHHVDSNPSNNNKSNLLLVCYNCHKELESKIRKRKRIID